jgi:hypothetical protein
MDRGGCSVHQRNHLRGSWLTLITALAIVLTGALAAGASAGKSQAGACASIDRLGLEKQMNARAAEILVACGRAPSGTSRVDSSGSAFSALTQLVRRPNVYGGTDKNLVTGGEGVFPHVTQSETQVWAQGNTVVAIFNDSKDVAPPPPPAPPVCLASGAYSTDLGVNFTNIHPFCTGHGTNYGDPGVVYDVAHAKWVAVFLATGCGGQGLGIWTSPDGATWTAPSCAHNGTADDRESIWVDNSASSPYYGRIYVTWNDFAGVGNIYSTYSNDGGLTWSAPVQVQSGTFIRNVQVTAGLDGRVFIAGMNEGGGGANPRINIAYYSANGGTTWTAVTMGASFTGPGDSNCTSNTYFRTMFSGYWRHMGWGDMGAGPSGIIHYAYAAHGTGDPGDIMYTRSTDNGATWSVPIKIDDDLATTRAQWQPSLSVAPGGQVFISWYDARQTTGTSYERWARLSNDNGATWQPAMVMSDVISPLPGQPDPNIQACYAGDYDRSYGNSTAFHSTWVDGRVSISGQAQQDVFYDKQTVGPPPPPAPNLVHDLTTLFDSNSNGHIDPGEDFGIDERIRNAGNAGATGISGVLTSATPGITITTGSSAYPDIPAGAMGTNTPRFMGSASNSLPCGGDVSFHLALTTGQGPFSVNFTVPEAECPNYTITTQTGQEIVAGTADTGNHCDDCVTMITLPFPVYIYGVPYTSASVVSNGNIQFTTMSTAFGNVCLPSPNHGRAFFPYWNDLLTNGAGQGIFTVTTGLAPNRVFYIEWRAGYFSGGGGPGGV